MNRTIWMLVLLCAVVAYGKAQEKIMPPQSTFFVANEGQWEEPVLFKLSGGGTTWFVTSTGMTMDIRQMERTGNANTGGLRRLNPPLPPDCLDRDREELGTIRGHVLRMNFVNANPTPQYEGQDKLSSYSNYFIGRDKCKWKSFVGHYQRITATEVWPGIDVEYSVFPHTLVGGQGGSSGVEILYHVKPQADLSQIIIEYEGLDAPLRLDNEGNLVLQTSLGEVKEKAPVAYQVEGKTQKQVPIRFKILSNNRYSLQCESYDNEKELLIDPLIYSTYFGGGYGVKDMEKDPQGNLVIAGDTHSSDFPVTPGAYQTTLPANSSNAYVTKLTSDGRQLIFSTYVGGSGISYSYCCLAETQGSIYIGGSTYSTNWPLTDNAFDTTIAGREGYLSRLSADGSELLDSSYIGGDGNDVVFDIKQDVQTEEIYLCGETGSSHVNFPITPDALYTESVGYPSYVAIFNPSTSALVYSTYFCPEFTHPVAEYLVVLGNRRVWIAGKDGWGGLPVTPDAFQREFGGEQNDGFFALLDLQANQLRYCSYLGGAGVETVYQLIPLADSLIILAGTTNSPDFPITSNAFDTSYNGGLDLDVFVTEIRLPNTLVYSTFLGGHLFDDFIAIVRNSDSSYTICGTTCSSDFPVTSDGLDTTWNNSLDAYICKFSSDLTQFEYGTFLGGAEIEWCGSALPDGQDSIWIGGETLSPDFPVTNDAFQNALPGYESNFLSHLYIGNGSNVSHPQKPIPSSFSLSIYPNPFNPSTTISFTLPKAGEVKMSVYDVLGRITKSAHPCGATMYAAGEHRIMFDGSDLASGIYFMRVEVGKDVMTRKMMILK